MFFTFFFNQFVDDIMCHFWCCAPYLVLLCATSFQHSMWLYPPTTSVFICMDILCSLGDIAEIYNWTKSMVRSVIYYKGPLLPSVAIYDMYNVEISSINTKAIIDVYRQFCVR